MIHEYARHNGHADLLREAVDGTVVCDPAGFPAAVTIPEAEHSLAELLALVAAEDLERRADAEDPDLSGAVLRTGWENLVVETRDGWILRFPRPGVNFERESAYPGRDRRAAAGRHPRGGLDRAPDEVRGVPEADRRRVRLRCLRTSLRCRPGPHDLLAGGLPGRHAHLPVPRADRRARHSGGRGGPRRTPRRRPDRSPRRVR